MKNETLALLKTGGLYVIDDLNRQPRWAEDHFLKVQHLLSVLESKEDLALKKYQGQLGSSKYWPTQSIFHM